MFTTCVCAAAFGYLICKFLSIEVMNGFENRVFFRIAFLILMIISKLSILGSKFGFGNQAILYKKLFSPLKNATKNYDGSLRIENRKINNIPVRIYSPKYQSKSLPALIYYHGGGYVFFSIDIYDILTFTIAKRLGIVVLTVDYRLAPENPYPIPMNDCWSVTDYVLKNTQEFNIDDERVALAGDSAGGAIVAIMNQRLVKENRQPTKLQVLVYPWMQHFDFSLPSYRHYIESKTVSFSGTSLNKLVLWVLGITQVSDDLEASLVRNEHTLLIDDKELRKKYSEYINPDLIPEKYKKGKSYYDNYKKPLFDNDKRLDENSILNKDKKLADLIKNLFNEDISPGLASDEILKKQPKSYFVVCELDELKDETLIYAERLRRNGVDTKIAYYEDGYHGIIASLSYFNYNIIAAKMVDDLIEYLKENL